MSTHSSILALKITWTEEPGRLQSMGSQRVGHNWVIKHKRFPEHRAKWSIDIIKIMHFKCVHIIIIVKHQESKDLLH